MCTMYISQDFWRGQYLSGGYNTYLFGVHSVQSMKEELDPVGSTVRYEMMKLGQYRTL